MPLSTIPNATLKLTKWPIAALMVLLLPGVVMALGTLSVEIFRVPDPLYYFAGGAIAYGILWQILLKRRFMGSFFSTFEHELTHALFAWLTLHRVTGLKTTWSQGGEMRYRGQGNWLISIAPYWFPTLCIPFIVLSGLGQFDGAVWVAPAFGATFAYHITSTIRETHRQQTDLQKTTFLFAWAFLPSANLISAGFIIAYAHSGLDAAVSFVDLSWQNTMAFVQR